MDCEQSISREYIANIRRPLESLPCKSPNLQQITLEYSTVEELNNCSVAILTIESGAKNALSGKMICELTDRLDELERWAAVSCAQAAGTQERRALLLMGRNGTFCSGSDLISVRACANQLDGLHLAQLMQYNLERLRRLPVMSFAFVEGYALGGGAELALSADFRLMSNGANIGFVHATKGICCGWGGGTRLVQLLGPTKALELMSSGRLVGAHEAARLGLAETGEFNSLREALEFVVRHAVEAPQACRAVKLLVEGALELAPALALQREAQLFASLWGKEAHLRALIRNVKHNSNSGSTNTDTNSP